jgi:hypothetical protein
MREIKESDWKILRQYFPVALDRFCQLVLSEIEEIQHDETTTLHQKYVGIFHIMRRRNEEMALVFDDPRRSKALMQLTALKARGLVTEDEFAHFSPETQQIVDVLLSH